MTMEHNAAAKGTVTKLLPLDRWPKQDLDMWTATISATDPFADQGGERAKMRPHSNRRLQASYARWLAFLQGIGELDRFLDPVARIRKDTVERYVLDLQGLGNMPSTTALRLTDLVLMARLFAPTGDWHFITRIARRIGATTVKGRDKRILVRGSHELFELGQKLMDESADKITPVEAAVMYRDGLIIAALALMPLRRRNLVQLRIGTEMRKKEDNWVITIPGASTKTHSPLDFDWPTDLLPQLETYLTIHRPVLAERCYRWPSRAADHLWVAATGSALTEVALYDIVRKRTKAAFGIAISPHAFRDAAATTLAVHDLKHVRLAAPVLGHTNFKTTEKYYNQARGLDAHRRYTETLARLRRSTRRSPQ